MRNTPLFLVSGRLKREATFTLADLLELDTVSTDERSHACGSGDPKGTLPPCTGVLLTDVINRCEVLTEDHNDTKRMYVAVSAGDGYTAIFSWQELFNTEVGEGVILVLERGAQKLCETDKRIDLVSSRDILSGPRYVKGVRKVELVLVE